MEVVENLVFAAFKDYLDSYLDFVERAEPMTWSAKLDNILPDQLRYFGYRSEKDQTRGIFKETSEKSPAKHATS